MENQNHISKNCNISFDQLIRGRLSTNPKTILLLWMEKFATKSEVVYRIENEYSQTTVDFSMNLNFM